MNVVRQRDLGPTDGGSLKPQAVKQRSSDDVIIVGAGLVGLACAYSLALLGRRPLVIDAEEPGAGASWGNAGWVAFSPPVVAPVPSPDVIPSSLRWLIQRDSPLRIVPAPTVTYLRWLARFARSCSPKVARSSLAATVAFNAGTAALFDELERAGLDLEMQRRGTLVVYGSRRSFSTARKKVFEDDGAQVLTPAEAAHAEPLLRMDSCVGAIRYSADRNVRPDKLIRALVATLEQMGVRIESKTPCVELLRSDRGVAGVRTPEGTRQASAVVLAAGVATANLARQVGARIPLLAGRGYSFDMPRTALPLQGPVYVYEPRLALTPFRDITRTVGMMELGVRTATVRPRAIDWMSRCAAAVFETWPTADRGEPWAGLRPMTPDGLPVIGRLEAFDNLYVASGHGMLGVTLSLRTGQAIADCLCSTDVDGGDPLLRAFSPARFRDRRYLAR